MLEAAFFALAIVTGGGALWLYARARHDRGQVWLSAAKSAGLTEVSLVNSVWGQSLVGRSDRLRVRIMFRQRDRDHPETRIVVDDTRDGLGGVIVRPEGANILGSAEIEVGDPGFDDTFFISGLPSLVYAFLDTRTRGTLFRMNEQGSFAILSTELQWDMPATEESRLLAKEIGVLLDVTRRLGLRTETAERLADNARNDLQPGVRLRNLLCLIREFSEHPVVDQTLRAACADRSPEVRLRAATALGADGVDTLVAMTADVGLPDVWQAAAVSALGRRFAIEQAVEGLERALRSHHFETARACIAVLGTGDQAAVEPLAKALAVQAGVVAASAATALGALQEPAAEQPLIRALWQEAPGLRVAAAEALGRSGSTAAVLPLKQAADRYPDTAFRRAARQAIAEIQARLPGASPGQLSLAAAESGQLSLADAESGQLSLADGHSGQLSLAESHERPKP